jgi:hypothetical protein
MVSSIQASASSVGSDMSKAPWVVDESFENSQRNLFKATRSVNGETGIALFSEAPEIEYNFRSDVLQSAWWEYGISIPLEQWNDMRGGILDGDAEAYAGIPFDKLIDEDDRISLVGKVDKYFKAGVDNMKREAVDAASASVGTKLKQALHDTREVAIENQGTLSEVVSVDGDSYIITMRLEGPDGNRGVLVRLSGANSGEEGSLGYSESTQRISELLAAGFTAGSMRIIFEDTGVFGRPIASILMMSGDEKEMIYIDDLGPEFLSDLGISEGYLRAMDGNIVGQNLMPNSIHPNGALGQLADIRAQYQVDFSHIYQTSGSDTPPISPRKTAEEILAKLGTMDEYLLANGDDAYEAKKARDADARKLADSYFTEYAGGLFMQSPNGMHEGIITQAVLNFKFFHGSLDGIDPNHVPQEQITKFVSGLRAHRDGLIELWNLNSSVQQSAQDPYYAEMLATVASAAEEDLSLIHI